ncbi:hypothetical protein C8R44DRAFT_676471, partial [Mycena epipterygia]
MNSEFGVLAASSSPGEGLLEVDKTLAALARHQKLLTTNEPPADPELTFIRSVVAKTGARLAHLDGEILRLQDRLKKLEEERAPLAIYHAQNNGILSPVRRLPPEVLGEIFSWTLPSARDALLRRRFDTKNSPWVLTYICGRWREVALSTPSLWSLVVI